MTGKGAKRKSMFLLVPLFFKESFFSLFGVQVQRVQLKRESWSREEEKKDVENTEGKRSLETQREKETEDWKWYQKIRRYKSKAKELATWKTR